VFEVLQVTNRNRPVQRSLCGDGSEACRLRFGCALPVVITDLAGQRWLDENWFSPPNGTDRAVRRICGAVCVVSSKLICATAMCEKVKFDLKRKQLTNCTSSKWRSIAVDEPRMPQWTDNSLALQSSRLPLRRRSSHCFAASSIISHAARLSWSAACLTALITCGLIIVRNCRLSPRGDLGPRFGFFSIILMPMLPSKPANRPTRCDPRQV
jgi:hypothetical protein